MLTDETEIQENPAAENPENPAVAPAIDDLIKKEAAKIAENAAEPLKRKRGRPRKVMQAEPAPVAQIPTEPMAPLALPPDYRPMLKDLASMGSLGLVEYLGTPEAALTDEEGERVAESCNPLMQKWFPEMGEMTPEWAALIGLATVAFSVGMRVRAARATPAQPAA